MAKLSRLLGNTALFGIIIGFLCSISMAQVSTGTIVGTITDASGAVVPGATVTVTNLGTGLKRVVKTNSTGDYNVPNLVAGHYSISVTHAGFSTSTVPDFEIQVAQRAEVNTVLRVGAATQKVLVTSSAIQLLNTQSSSVGQVIDTKAVVSMPLNGREFWQLTELTPGVQYSVGGGGGGVPAGGGQIRAAAVNVTVNGHASAFTGWYLDGADITEPQIGGTMIQPNVDAIQEFKVEGGDMSAQYGHMPTAVNTTLKSGTNQFHGVAYEFLRNSAMDAKNFFYVPPPGTHYRVEPLHRNQFGGVLGGPIRRDRTYFFVDLENTRLSQSQDYNNIVASPLERTGNFSQSGKTIIDPTTGQPFSGDTIPSDRISSQAKFLLPYMPTPNYISNNVYREINSNPLTQNLIHSDLKIDEQLTASDHIMGRYSISNNQETDPNPYPAMGQFPDQARGQDVEVSWTHTLSPRWINTVIASYYRSMFTFSSTFTGQDINTPAGINGLQGLAPLSKMGFPTLDISNYSNFTGASAADNPKQNRIRSPEYQDIASYSFGKHDITFGADILHNTLMYANGAIASGVFQFSQKYSGDNFADFLLGLPYEGQRSYYSALYGNVGTFQGYYFQDNYRIRPNLTLNLGVRWEVNPFYYGDKGQLAGYDLATNKLVIPYGFSIHAQPITPTLYPLFQDRIELTNVLNLPPSISPTERHDIMPRFGAAWSPTPKWVFRTSYGMFYVIPDDNLINNTVTSVPFVASQTVINTVGPTGPVNTLGNFFGNQPIATGNPHPGTACSFGLVLNSCSTPSVTPMAMNLKQQYINEWNVSVQHEFGSRVSLDVAYVGNNTVNGEERDSINDPTPGPGAVQTRRPVPQWSTIGLGIFNGYGSYNALQTKLETQAWHGATLLASYTYSKCLDSGTYNSNTVYVDSPLQFYGPCSFNLKHNLVVSYVYQLPFGRGQAILGSAPSWLNQAIGGWELTGVTTAQSGLPFTTTISSDVANTGVSGQRPNIVASPTVIKNPNCWFYVSANPACRALAPSAANAFVVPAQYTYGDGGRNNMTQDDLIEWDTAIEKRFLFSGERSLEIRGEAFNIFNRTTFGAPSTNIDQSTGATVSQTFVAPREIEVAAKIFF